MRPRLSVATLVKTYDPFGTEREFQYAIQP